MLGVCYMYTIELYNLNTLIGKYLVDTTNKKLDVLYSNIASSINTNFKSYTLFKEFLEGRMVDMGRVNRKELLGYSQVPWNVWEEMKRTHGFDMDDYLWVKLVGIDKDNLSIRNFHPRVYSKAVSVYG